MNNKESMEKYAGFYGRAFSEVNIEKILSEGGAYNYENFKNVSKKNVTNKDYWDALFINGKRTKDALGRKIFEYFFMAEKKVEFNKINRAYVPKGERIFFEKKIYKGGQFLPKAFLLQPKI